MVQNNQYKENKIYDGKIITLDILSKSIANKIGLEIKEAHRDAGFVMDMFGFDDRIVDHALDL